MSKAEPIPAPSALRDEPVPPPSHGVFAPTGPGRRIGRTVAGPALIVLGVVIALHDYAFSTLVRTPYIDTMPFWLPTHCYLGTSLAAGHIPAWNPYVLGGTPFAADPQSGWMYLPVMALYSLFPCLTALRLFVLLQPILAGLGIYWFLRAEDVSRPASTAGGLTLALAIAGYVRLATDLPFAGTLAWSSMLLAAGARYLRATSWPSRLGWLAAVAGAWGQLAAAHLSDGLVMGTTAFAFYVGARLIRDLLTRRTEGRAAAIMVGLLFVAMPLVNLAFFLPRLAYLGRSSLGLGFLQIRLLSKRLSGHPAQAVWGTGAGPGWPLGLARSSGLYLGAASLLLTFGAWASRRHIHLAAAFAAYGVLTYVAVLRTVARTLAPYLSKSLGNFYAHSPDRFTYGFLLAIAVLAGLGVEAWRTLRSNAGRLLILVPGLLVWGLLPAVFGETVHWQWFVIGLAVAAVALWSSAWRPRLIAVVPIAIAAELVGTALAGEAATRPLPGRTVHHAEPRVSNPQPTTKLDLAAYLRRGPIVEALRSAAVGGVQGRYLSVFPTGQRGALLLQEPIDWGLLANQRSILFHVESADGYNPAQLLRFWEFVRAAERKKIAYNASFFIHPPPVALNLLQVRWVVALANAPPPASHAIPITTDGQWQLYRLTDAPPRASLYTSFRVVDSSDSALTAVRSAGFEPASEVVLEEVPSIRTSAGPSPGTAAYRSTGPQSAVITVQTSRPAIVLVRNVYDSKWRATVDGEPVRILPTDYLDQGIPVPAGPHVILLTYDDGSIALGLVGSLIALAGLLGAAWALKKPLTYRPPPSARESPAGIDPAAEQG